MVNFSDLFLNVWVSEVEHELLAVLRAQSVDASGVDGALQVVIEFLLLLARLLQSDLKTNYQNSVSN